MTDPFEESVRRAAQGLGATTGAQPTYHDAWQRGRRRRLVKRTGLAAAACLALLAALSVNLNGIPGTGSTETDDVAVAIEAATTTPPTAVATTAPLFPAATNGEPTESPVATATADTAADSESTTVDEPEPPPTATVAPTAAPSVPAPTSAPATATQVPIAPTPVPNPSPTPLPTEAPTFEDPNPSDSSTDAENSDDGTNATSTDDGTPNVAESTTDADESAASSVPTDVPRLALTGPAGETPSDARVLPGVIKGVRGVPCDTAGAGVPDATCELLPEYSCATAADAAAGYMAVDTTGDAVIDTCVAVDLTTCDTTGDGLGDTPCIIELLAIDTTTAVPGDSTDE